MLRASIPSSITIKKDIGDNCGPVMINPTWVHQIIMNLCTNGAQAMEHSGGTLTVSYASNGSLTDDAHKRSCAVLTVSDTGVGMQAEMLEKIFDPYFTTKVKDDGTGLGLAVVQGIVTKCGGSLDVQSEPGSGTTFSIYLPMVKESNELPLLQQLRR